MHYLSAMASPADALAGGTCGIPCGCGTECPLPTGHAGRYWAEHPQLIHSHLAAPIAAPAGRAVDRWWVALSVLAGLIGLAVTVGFSALPGD